MRTIKFRGKRIDNGEWIYGDLSQSYNGLCSINPIDSAFMYFDREQVITETVGQFTGIFDKNGKEIYESDILHGREEGDGETTAWRNVYFQIFYCEKTGSFMAKELGIKYDSWNEFISDINQEYEVIGNIHENREVLN